MKRAIIVHGACDESEFFGEKYPSLSNSNWIPWLQKQLVVKGILTQSPEMPEPYNPDYNQWEKEFSQFIADGETTLIGYSCGGGFLVRWLSENPVTIDKLVLVAPWLDPFKKDTVNFSDFKVDPQMSDRIKKSHILISEDDYTDGIRESLEIVQKGLPNAFFHPFKNKGHFTYEEIGEKFPELLEIILG